MKFLQDFIIEDIPADLRAEPKTVLGLFSTWGAMHGKQNQAGFSCSATGTEATTAPALHHGGLRFGAHHSHTTDLQTESSERKNKVDFCEFWVKLVTYIYSFVY